MTKEKINYNNELIAEFMNFEYENDITEFSSGSVIKTGKGYIIPHLVTEDYKGLVFNDQLLFHKSWDWLMPVVVKMVSLEKYYDFSDGCKNKIYIEGNPLCIFSLTEEYDVNFTIETLWQECVKFIKWYNKKLNK